MGRITLTTILFVVATGADAAWYLKADGPPGMQTKVDPIMDTTGNVLSYSGPNVEPGANLDGQNLEDADLFMVDLQSGASLLGTNLSDAWLSMGILTGANLTNANLNGARLTYTDLGSALLVGADLTSATLSSATSLSQANLSGAIFSDLQDYEAANWSGAFYYNDHEPTWASGMDSAWRSSVGIQARTMDSGNPTTVPEPATLLLSLLGLALLGVILRNDRR
ncbi:MAG: pentapeptide repeat-containing protein [Planctomycetota bacterium]|nr:pentapeptide repeat-containing protein [Planctomycetota bacterium]